MAQAQKTTPATKEAGTDAGTWKPTAEAKKKATTLRITAIVLWVVAIAAEAGAIFWLLRQREAVGGSGEAGLARDPETGLLVDEAATFEFPQWAFITLIVVLVVIAALSIIANFLWLPWYPWWSLTVIALDIVVIWAVATWRPQM